MALTYDGSGKAAGARLYVDGERAAVEIARDTLAGPIATDAPLTIGRRSLGPPFLGQIDDLRVYGRVLEPGQIANLAIHYPARVIISGVFGKRATAEAAEVRDYFLTHAAPEALRTAYAELKALNKEKEEFEKGIPTAMVMAEMKKPRDTFVLARGDYRNQTEKVQPGVPAMLPPLPKDAPLNRLTLAQWLVDPNHPLTARVAVNRFWQMYFGSGIVKTQEDFGVQGEPPVHPELLDWLATEFVRTGWDVRAMQRAIVTSATYRQSSTRDAGPARTRPGEPAPGARAAITGSRPKRSATRRWRRAGCSIGRSAVPACVRTSRTDCGRRWRSAKATPGSRTSRAAARISTAAACIRCGSVRFHPLRSRSSTRPIGRSARPAAP